jgi:hypothetical protein
MAWVNWSRRATAEGNGGSLGIEISASRARAAAGSAADNRLIALDLPHPDLPLAISLEQRTPAIGRAGSALVRLQPLAVCDEFLPFLGEPREWRAGRHRFNAAAAVSLLLDKLRPLFRDSASVFIGLPSYLTQKQAAEVAALAAKNRFPLSGTMSSALALAADRAGPLMSRPLSEIEKRVDGIVPLYRSGKKQRPADVIVVDADDHALSCSLIRMESAQVSLLATATLPAAGVKRWKKALLDGFSDRCIRVCRRDPRDSAAAEQSLYEQIDDGLDGVRSGKHVVLSARAAHWYQDLHLLPEDFESCCAALIRSSVQAIGDLLNGDSLNSPSESLSKSPSEPPRAVWMTHEAGRLPGLAAAVRQHMAERTSVSVLRPESVAVAVANLGERWPTAALQHLHQVIPISFDPPESRPQAATKKTRR